MSDERIDLLRRFHEIWGAGDLEGALECVHPEIDFDWTESMSPFKAVFHGHDGMRRFWNEMRDAFEEFKPEIDELVDGGDEGIVTRNTIHSRSRSGGIALEAHGAMHWLFADGKIVRAKMFQTVDEALEALRDPKPQSI